MSFIQVFRKLSTFRGESALSTWLYRLAVNTALMHFESRHRGKCRWTKPASTRALPWHDANNAAAMLASVLLWTEFALRAALEALPVGYRTIF